MKLLKQSDHKTSSADSIKWLGILVLLTCGIIANFYYAAQPFYIRLVAGLLLTAVALFIAFQTQKGKQLLGFARESQVEMRKVVWPTRQETIQSTMIVIGVVIVVGLMLWGIDSFLLWLVGMFTGQRG
ncbi:MAG: preprotein translocase subunit SecE [Proteobacteria bacterium]|nr:preprotein translocase subunit SecE [Pseudomonadota bacterium]